MFLLCKVASLTLAAVLTLCGQVPAERIIGGHAVQNHSRPYMVLLVKKFTNGAKGSCGGFLVSADFVLTAAHCQADSYKVLVGLNDYYQREGVQQFDVEKVFPHANYSNRHHINDIMLLKLNTSAKLTEQVKPIALADNFNNYQPKSCSVSGWGRTKINGSKSVILMEANVQLIKNKMCVKKEMYCSSGDTGPAKGDSGGPLVCEDGKVHGVVAEDYKQNKNAQRICMYTKIVDNRDWIDAILNK